MARKLTPATRYWVAKVAYVAVIVSAFTLHSNLWVGVHVSVALIVGVASGALLWWRSE